MRQKILSIINAYLYSISGMKYLLKERAFLQELILGCVILLIELFRSSTPIMRIYLFSSYVIVLIAEALNTAVEATINRISLEKHELSKQAKDIGSAAVFIALTHLGIVWLLPWLMR